MSKSRRTVLAAGAGGLATLAGCRRKPGPPSRVAIQRAESYSQDLAGMLRRAIAEQRFDVRGKRVLLKPNLVEFDPGTAINTNPALVAAAMDAFRGAGAADVRIAEGPGHRRNTLELAEAAGYFQAVPDFERIFTDLNTDDVERIPLARAHSRLESVYLPRTALRCDLLVSMPKMKCHHWVGATLSMKNLFGLVPGAVYGWPKNVLHWAGINECIADLHSAAGSRFAIVDGIVGMEGNGPIQGTPKAAGVIVTGTDPVAVDATCCRIMEIDPESIGYLKLCAENGQTAEGGVQQIGEPVRAVRTEFKLIPQFSALRLKRA